MVSSRRLKFLAWLFVVLVSLVALGACALFNNPASPLQSLQPPTLLPTLQFVGPTSASPTPTLAYPTLPPAWTPTLTPVPPTITWTPPPVTPGPTPSPIYRFGPDHFPDDVNPLTGEVASDPALLAHRPLAIKIANTRPCARPQAGLNQAALVFEHYVEAWGTRFTAIFYGSEVENIGPVRSARLIDLELPAIFDAILVASGESAGVKQRLRASDFSDRIFATDFDTGCPPLCRVPQESVPCADPAHTLYTNTRDLFAQAAKAGLDARPPLTGWAFRSAPPGRGRPANILHVGYFNAPVDWTYDAASSNYLRSQDGTRQVDALTQRRLTAANVVILFAHHLYSDIQESSNFYSLEIQFWGQGRAILFRDGRAFEGSWLRPERAGLFRLVDASGALIPLKPGRTWFEFVALDSVVEGQENEWTVTVPILPEQTPPRP